MGIIRYAYCLTETRREKIVDQLLKAGADVNALTSDGLTPLATLLRNKQWTEEETKRLLSKLLECNADPNIGENPPLCFATETMNILIIKKLLESGAEINKPNKEWKSPLSCCLHKNRAGKLFCKHCFYKLLDSYITLNAYRPLTDD